MHFVEVRVEEMGFCTAGIGNADPVFRQFTVVLLKITSSGSANADPGLGICK